MVERLVRASWVRRRPMTLEPTQREPIQLTDAGRRSWVAQRAGLLTSAALGAGVVATRATARAAGLAFALPRRALVTAAQTPAVTGRLTELEREWLAIEDRARAALWRELDRIVPVLADYIIDRIDMKAMAGELVEDLDIPAMV